VAYQFGWFKTSNVELFDLFKAWIAISLAFTFAFVGFGGSFGFGFLISLIVVGTAFLFHELSHKVVAQKFKYHAEFRSFDGMLFLAMAVGLLGFVFAAPGAVMIRMRRLNVKKNGMIAAAGPLMNLFLAAVFLLIFNFWITPYTWMINGFSVGIVLIKINSFIALFNMIPVWQFDGAKIIKWNVPVYVIMVLLAFVITFLF
jgi:Zn-dependent protease